MKTTKTTFCTAEGETIDVFATELAKLSSQGKTIIAKFEGKVLYLTPGSNKRDILNMFEHLEYNSAQMTFIGNL